MRITIETTNVTQKGGTSQRTGKPYSIREQEGWLHTGARYPLACKLALGKDQAPYQPGDYIVENALTVDRFCALVVNRDLRLVAAPRATKAA